MARPKRSLSSLLDDEQPVHEQVSTGEEPVAAPQPAEERLDAPLVIVPAQPEPVAVAVEEKVVASEPTTVAVAEVTPVAPQDAPAVPAPAPSERSPKSADGPVSAPAKSRTAAVRQIKVAPEPEPERLPLYLELTRKEARFRQDQLNALTTLTRQLNRRRASTGERITDNTLIRVAVDMMLEVAESLDGTTEADLLAAVRARLK